MLDSAAKRWRIQVFAEVDEDILEAQAFWFRDIISRYVYVSSKGCCKGLAGACYLMGRDARIVDAIVADVGRARIIIFSESDGLLNYRKF